MNSKPKYPPCQCWAELQRVYTVKDVAAHMSMPVMTVFRYLTGRRRPPERFEERVSELLKEDQDQ